MKTEERAKDWVEDFSHENGNYMNVCSHCDSEFYGHKRRIICKECDNKIKYSDTHLDINPQSK